MTVLPSGKRMRQFIALLLVVIQFFLIPLSASADDLYEIKKLVFFHGNDVYTVRLLRVNGILFACSDDLANLKKCSTRFLEQPTRLTFFTDQYVILCEYYDSEYINCDNLIFVPFSDALSALGLDLHIVDDRINVTVYRTPLEFLRVLDRIVDKEDFYLYNIIQDSEGYIALGEILAKTYALLSPFAFKTWWDVATSSDDQKKYDQAFTKILSNDGSATEILTGLVNLDSKLLKSEKLISYLDEFFYQDGKFAELLRSFGIDEETVRSLLLSEDPYSNGFDAWLHEYKEVSDAIDFKYLFDVFKFYAFCADLDESVLLALQLVFADTDNQFIRSSIEQMINIRLEGGITSVENLYSGYAGRMLFNTFLTSFEKYYVDASLDKKYISFEKDIFNRTFDMDAKMSATQFLPVYSNIQSGLLSYYLTHKNDGEHNTAKEMRAIVIMYLKTATAAYETFSFDRSLEGSVLAFNGNCELALSEIMDFEESEYCPQYDNQAEIEWISTKFDSIQDNEAELQSDSNHNDDPSMSDPFINESAQLEQWLKYEGLWHAGGYYEDSGIYEEQLGISFTTPKKIMFKWHKYRVAYLSGDADFDVNTGCASFRIYDKSLEKWFSGTLRLIDDTVVFTVEESEDHLLPAGSSFTYVEMSDPNSLANGKYYAKIKEIDRDSLVCVDFKIQQTFSEEYIQTLMGEEHAIVRIDGYPYYVSRISEAGDYGSYYQKSTVIYLGLNEDKPDWYRIMKSGLNGEWALIAPSDAPCFKETITKSMRISENAVIEDDLYHMRYGVDPGNTASIRDLMERWGSEFYNQYFIVTVENNEIVGIKMIYMI